jgi:hypothetical protein
MTPRRRFPPARCRCRAACCVEHQVHRNAIHAAYLCAEEPVGDRLVCLACERRSAEALSAAGRQRPVPLVHDDSWILYVVRRVAEVAPGVERIPFRFESAAWLCATLLTSGMDSGGYPHSSANPDGHPFCVIRLADDALPEEE